MKRILMGVPVLFLLVGCTPSFWGGAAGGAVGTGAGYEYNANKELDRIKTEYDAGRMTEKEYNIRKDQIRRMSVIQ